MRKVLVTTIATLATAMLFTINGMLNAAIYKFTFQSSNGRRTDLRPARFTVNAADEVTGVSGAISGLTNQTISGVDRQSELPEPVLQPRRLVHLRQPVLIHRHALRLSTGCCSPRRENPGGYWNLWANSPGRLTRSVSWSAATITRSQEIGTLSVGRPRRNRRPGRCWLWASLRLGFVGRRRRRAPRLAPGPRLDARTRLNAAGAAHWRPFLVYGVMLQAKCRKRKLSQF